MERFEYTMVPWPPSDNGSGVLDLLNELGAEGWEAFGVAPRATPSLPMPGMGADLVPEMVVLMKRRMD